MIKDVEPLLKECEETLKELMKMGDMEAACYVQGFINSINKLPDAEQRQHGRWSEIDLDNFRKYKVVCPFCGMEYIDNYDGYVDVNDFNFCPNCGAAMDAEE